MKLLVCILLISLFTNCATTCNTPEDRASDFGPVLECKDVLRHGKPYRKCQVLTKNGVATVTYKICS
jgi:hypothetical protein